jgi:hypothetical protein
MRRSRSFTVLSVLACVGACAMEPEPEVFDDEEAETDVPDPADESSVEPGCTFPPTHWCEPFQVQAQYPDPGPYGSEIGYFGCVARADADLETRCWQHGGGLGVGCCGGTNEPNPNNHDHPYAEWSAGTWYCSGSMRLRHPCTPSSTNPECQPLCD